ncbi:MAG: divergent polysaccharide deacetylase family protein [Bdellovibrionales bacterium]
MPAAAADNSVESASAPRKETFLALYPRKFKLGVLGGMLAVLVLPWLIFGGADVKKTEDEYTRVKTAVSSVESHAAVVNAAPRPAETKAPVTAKPEAAARAPDTEAATDPDERSIFLTPAPDPRLSEDTPLGTLPRISEEGRQPWQVYARPFDMADTRPRIAVVITDLGLLQVPTDAAIDLPPDVTLAFDSQSPVAASWCARARQAGHETLLMLPMEPYDYPRSDPGPNTLLSNLSGADNLQRLQKSLMRASGYVGVTTLSGTRFTTDPERIKAVLDVLRRRGLMIFDARVAPLSAIADLAREAHVPVVSVTQRLDQNLSPAAIDETLAQIEQSARLTGRAVVMAPPLPVVIARLKPWIKQLRKDGIALAPLTAMVQ